jgi:TetR/AcrR family transcriptional regulator, cholesterol catabolism regulator
MVKRSAAVRKPKANVVRPSNDDDGTAGRRRQIMTEAARLFATKGFDATTIRDIAGATGILGGSIYYHFASKEEIFLAVHSAGMDLITSAVSEAVGRHTDPWDRLEAAAAAHCAALLSSHELPVLVSPYFSDAVGSLRADLVAQRDRYDRMIAELVDDLDLPDTIDRHIFRLHFLGALNWTPTWYREGPLSPTEIGRTLVRMLKPASDGPAAS